MIPLLLTLALTTAADATEVIRRALVVGVNDGGVGLEPLRYAEADAERMAGVLTELGGFERRHVTVLLAPDRRALEATLDAFASEVPPTGESLFVFYYSGHADARGLRLHDEVVPYERLKERIRAVPADVRLGVLDACQSGAITRLKGARLSEPFLDEVTLAAEGEAWIAASAADEDAQESDWLQGSFFTHYLLSGLRGAADSGDGRVSLAEAYAYAYERTVARTVGTMGGTQHPSYAFRIQGNGDLALTEVRRATATLVLEESDHGEIAVLRQPEGTPVAEVAKLEGRPVTLALEPGRYVLRKRANGELRQVTVNLAEGGRIRVHEWGDARQEVALAKGVAPDDDGDPFLSVGGRGVEGAKRIVLDVQNEMQSVELRGNPAIAGTATAVLPGAGQIYSGRWWPGLGFFGATLALNGGAWGWAATQNAAGLASGSPTGPTPLTLAGVAVYGFAIADAVQGVDDDRPRERPIRGTTISMETVWHDDPALPLSSGLALDHLIVPGLSVGLDRTGYLRASEEEAVLFSGLRATAGIESGRIRPAVLLSGGMRVYLPTADTVIDPYTTLVLGAGAEARWYLTRRYFVQLETRTEWERPDVRFTAGGGLGLHFGG